MIMHHKFPALFFTGSCLENQKYSSVYNPKNKHRNFLLSSHLFPNPLLHFTEKFSRGLLKSMSLLPLVNLHGDHFNQSLITPTPPKVLWSRSPLTTMLLSNGYDKVMIRPYFTRTLNSIFANWSFIPSFWKLSSFSFWIITPKEFIAYRTYMFSLSFLGPFSC